MPQNALHHSGESIKVPESFTGFVATYDDGTAELEREGYYSERTRRLMATSWPEVNLEKLVRVDLYWRGQMKASVLKSEHPHMKPSDWFFSQTAYMDIQRTAFKVVSRNVGYRGDDGLTYLMSVKEADGALEGSVRA